jgi:uncharacterized membrane protein YdcZ (DUF606 family)
MMIAFICVGMLIFSSLIYYADDRKTFTSIPHSFWWVLIAMRPMMDRMYLNLSWMKAILKTYSNVKNTIQHRSMTNSVCVGMLIFSSLIYYADDRKTFTSIPHSFWWALITYNFVYVLNTCNSCPFLWCITL